MFFMVVSLLPFIEFPSPIEWRTISFLSDRLTGMNSPINSTHFISAKKSDRNHVKTKADRRKPGPTRRTCTLPAANGNAPQQKNSAREFLYPGNENGVEVKLYAGRGKLVKLGSTWGARPGQNQKATSKAADRSVRSTRDACGRKLTA